MDKEREKAIGARLRAFRETLQIPRTKFALAIGCSGEQLAAYEAGRARLPYSVFISISKRYFLSPFWLAMGGSGGSPRFDKGFDDGNFAGQVSPRALFSEIYDKHIANMLEPLRKAARNEWEEVKALIQQESRELTLSTPPSDEVLDRQIRLLKSMVEARKKDTFFRQKVTEKLIDAVKDKASLDNCGVLEDDPDVKRIRSLRELINELQELTKVRGRKAALANHLGVSPQAVHQFLTEQAKPSAETTFEMLNWVEQIKRKP